MGRACAHSRPINFRSFAERALELDDELAEAHVTLGGIHLSDDWDWPAAERAFERAMELDPDSATAQWLAGSFLSVTGKR